MGKNEKLRRGNGEGAIFQRANGLWVARLELPPKPNGDRRRKEITAITKERLLAKLKEPRIRLHMDGDLPSASQKLSQWLTYWLDEIAAKRLRPNTFAGYRSVVNQQVIPSIGNIRLDKLTPAHVRRMQTYIIDQGRTSTYALNAHRVLSKALVDAQREGLINRNPAELTDAPRKRRAALESLDVEEAIALIQRAVPELDGHTEKYDPEPARWAVYVLTAMRRGELLGLEWGRIDFETDTIDLSWQLQRVKNIADAPADYEYRPIANGMYWTRPKTSAGWRVIPLVEPLRSVLAAHQRRSEPNPYGLVFATVRGLPIDPDTETGRWPEALKEAGITSKKVRLHDIRHTTVDLLLEAGVPEDVVMEIVGHSQRVVTRGYKDPSKLKRRREAMEQLSTYLGVKALAPAPDGVVQP